jgi:hypothetical protein
MGEVEKVIAGGSGVRELNRGPFLAGFEAFTLLVNTR